MAALTLTELTQREFPDSAFNAYGKATLTSSGYVAFKIPQKTHYGVYVFCTVNTSAEFKVEYTGSSDTDMAAGTHRTFNAFGANQTASVDITLEPGVRAVIITWVSGSVTIEVEAK